MPIDPVAAPVNDVAGPGPGTAPAGPVLPVPAGVPSTARGYSPGLLEAGNIDLNARPIHRNPDGSISTVRSMSFADQAGGPEILIPTIADNGDPLSDNQAIDLYRRTGKHLGKFKTPDDATAYAKQLHEDQARQYLPRANAASDLPNDPAAVARQGLADTNAATNESVQAAKEKAALEKQQADAKADFDQKNADALAKFQADQVKHRSDADAEIASKRAAFENAPFRSLWSTRTAGQKAEIALGLLAGGISWNSNHTNRAIDILNQAEQEDLARQKEQHADLWRDLQLSLDNRKELDSRQLHELSDWQSLQAAKWNAIAGKLNVLIAANKGRADVADAEKARVEALDKANQAWTNAVNAKAAARHLGAQTKLTQEETLNQPGIRAKNAAETQKLLAEAQQGGLSKFEQQLITKIPTMLQRDPDVKVLYGNDATPGPLRVLPRVAQLQEDIKSGVASGDSTKVMESVIASKELLSKLLTGGQLNETKAKVLDSIQGNPAETRAKLQRLLGDPKASEQLVHGVYGLLDDVREQNLKVTDDARGRLFKRHLDPRNPIAKSAAIKDELQSQIEALTSGVTNGGGAPRYPEGGASPAPAKPSADLVTIKNNKTGETKQVTRDEAKRLGAL